MGSLSELVYGFAAMAIWPLQLTDTILKGLGSDSRFPRLTFETFQDYYLRLQADGAFNEAQDAVIRPAILSVLKELKHSPNPLTAFFRGVKIRRLVRAAIKAVEQAALMNDRSDRAMSVRLRDLNKHFYKMIRRKAPEVESEAAVPRPSAAAQKRLGRALREEEAPVQRAEMRGAEEAVVESICHLVYTNPGAGGGVGYESLAKALDFSVGDSATFTVHEQFGLRYVNESVHMAVEANLQHATKEMMFRSASGRPYLWQVGEIAGKKVLRIQEPIVVNEEKLRQSLVVTHYIHPSMLVERLRDPAVIRQLEKRGVPILPSASVTEEEARDLTIRLIEQLGWQEVEGVIEGRDDWREQKKLQEKWAKMLESGRDILKDNLRALDERRVADRRAAKAAGADETRLEEISLGYEKEKKPLEQRLHEVSDAFHTTGTHARDLGTSNTLGRRMDRWWNRQWSAVSGWVQSMLPSPFKAQGEAVTKTTTAAPREDNPAYLARLAEEENSPSRRDDRSYLRGKYAAVLAEAKRAPEDVHQELQSRQQEAQPMREMPTVYYFGIGNDYLLNVLPGTGYGKLVGIDQGAETLESFTRTFKKQARLLYRNEPEIAERVIASANFARSEPEAKRFEVSFKTPDGKDRTLILYAGYNAFQFVPQEVEAGYDRLYLSGSDYFVTDETAAILLDRLNPGGIIDAGTQLGGALQKRLYARVDPGQFAFVQGNGLSGLQKQSPALRGTRGAEAKERAEMRLQFTERPVAQEEVSQVLDDLNGVLADPAKIAALWPNGLQSESGRRYQILADGKGNPAIAVEGVGVFTMETLSGNDMRIVGRLWGILQAGGKLQETGDPALRDPKALANAFRRELLGVSATQARPGVAAPTVEESLRYYQRIRQMEQDGRGATAQLGKMTENERLELIIQTVMQKKPGVPRTTPVTSEERGAFAGSKIRVIKVSEIPGMKTRLEQLGIRDHYAGVIEVTPKALEHMRKNKIISPSGVAFLNDSGKYGPRFLHGHEINYFGLLGSYLYPLGIGAEHADKPLHESFHHRAGGGTKSPFITREGDDDRKVLEEIQAYLGCSVRSDGRFDASVVNRLNEVPGYLPAESPLHPLVQKAVGQIVRMIGLRLEARYIVDYVGRVRRTEDLAALESLSPDDLIDEVMPGFTRSELRYAAAAGLDSNKRIILEYHREAMNREYLRDLATSSPGAVRDWAYAWAKMRVFDLYMNRGEGGRRLIDRWLRMEIRGDTLLGDSVRRVLKELNVDPTTLLRRAGPAPARSELEEGVPLTTPAAAGRWEMRGEEDPEKGAKTEAEKFERAYAERLVAANLGKVPALRALVDRYGQEKIVDLLLTKAFKPFGIMTMKFDFSLHLKKFGIGGPVTAAAPAVKPGMSEVEKTRAGLRLQRRLHGILALAELLLQMEKGADQFQDLLRRSDVPLEDIVLGKPEIPYEKLDADALRDVKPAKRGSGDYLLKLLPFFLREKDGFGMLLHMAGLKSLDHAMYDEKFWRNLTSENNLKVLDQCGLSGILSLVGDYLIMGNGAERVEDVLELLGDPRIQKLLASPEIQLQSSEFGAFLTALMRGGGREGNYKFSELLNDRLDKAILARLEAAGITPPVKEGFAGGEAAYAQAQRQYEREKIKAQRKAKLEVLLNMYRGWKKRNGGSIDAAQAGALTSLSLKFLEAQGREMNEKQKQNLLLLADVAGALNDPFAQDLVGDWMVEISTEEEAQVLRARDILKAWQVLRGMCSGFEEERKLIAKLKESMDYRTTKEQLSVSLLHAVRLAEKFGIDGLMAFLENAASDRAGGLKPQILTSALASVPHFMEGNSLDETLKQYREFYAEGNGYEALRLLGLEVTRRVQSGASV
ncbi:MAG: hypothetical protein WC352_07785, partial [Candidatus Omnitrophota bacterium]